MKRFFALVALCGCSDPGPSDVGGSTGAAAPTSTSTPLSEPETSLSDSGSTLASNESSGSDSGDGSVSSSSSSGATAESSGSSSTGEPLVPGPCGDGVLNLGEACDDSNVEDEDGCSADCSMASCLVPVTHGTIQELIDDASCETGWILPGEYAENVTIERDVTLVGMDFEPVVVDGGGRGSVFTTGDVDVTFRHLRITGGVNDTGGGINANEGRIDIDGCEIDGNRAEGEGELAWARGGGIAGSYTSFDIYGGTRIADNVASSTADGGAYAEGGGLFVNSGRADISDGVVFDGNRAEAQTDDAECSAHGGAIFSSHALVDLIDTTITGNVATAESADAGYVFAYGGGVHHTSRAFDATDVVIEGNLVEVTTHASLNAGAFGGGLHLTNSSTDLERVTIGSNRVVIDNDHDAEGGGLFFNDRAGAHLDLLEVTVVDNEAEASVGRGGGIRARAGSVRFIRSLAAGNTASTEGGFAYFIGGLNVDLQLTNSTISGNSAPDGGSFVFGGASGPELFMSNMTITDNSTGIRAQGTATGEVRNSIVWGNGGADCTFADTATVASAGYNITSCVLGGDLTGNLDVDPELGALGDNGGPTYTHDIGPTSPARNGGDPGGCVDADLAALALDQRGEDRHTEDLCDIGAFEYVPES